MTKIDFAHQVKGEPIGMGSRQHMKVALCVIAKKENRYLAEFVGYYRNLGFDHIYIYDNNDRDGERMEEVVTDEVASGFVEIVDRRGVQSAQLDAYNDCYSRYGAGYDWMAFFDVDEFLTFSEDSKIVDVKEFLSMERFASVNVVCVNWMCYGDNGELRYRPAPVVERFPVPMKFDKCVFYTFPHNCHVKSFLRCCRPLVWRSQPHCPCSSGEGWSACDANGRAHADGVPFSDYDFSVAYLRHYWTKTAEEFAESVQRGYALQEVDELFMRCQIEAKFFGANEKDPKRIAVLAEKIPWFRIGFDGWFSLMFILYWERKQFQKRSLYLETQLGKTASECVELSSQNEVLNSQYVALKEAYDEISTSACWRMTKPIRWMLDRVKKVMRKQKRNH